ncbi:hypothetical protein GIB67_018516 [Kingdonia uniflora]|uniref:Uncharacterized protein n=1 Tax=Kingdonia uniflora TaxID=39325 RepID=A0A7J7LW43_9MAGN|nr:hypothetical protein GIB67_018516 [Kingdonia uniflora]
MVDQGRQITEAVTIPVIGDGDNGYGNAMSVKRTVKGFIKAGFAGIILEDQKGDSRDETVMRIKAAIDARKESGSDIVIIARTDSRQAISLEESFWRSRAFADAGVDVLFIDALSSKEEMKALCEITPLLPKMANMLEGGGKTPILNPIELEEIGFKLLSYPISLIGVFIRAMQDALTTLIGGRMPPPGSLPSFDEIKETLGFNTYYEDEERFITTTSQPPFQRDDGEEQELVVEVVTPEVYYGSDGPKGPFGGMWSRTLRVEITGQDGSEKLELWIPVGFLEGISNLVPALGGVNIKELLDNATGELGGKLLLDFDDTMGDMIQLFLD